MGANTIIAVNGCYRPSVKLSAFSLIELLVVIAIVLVLCSLLLPAVQRAKAKAQSIGCLNNLKQWGIGTHVFASDNDDYLPKDGAASGRSIQEGWYIDLPKSLGLAPYYEMSWHTNPAVEPGNSIWICPANRRRSNGSNLFHYCLNQYVNALGSGNQVRLGWLRQPSTLVWLFDNGGLAPVARQNNVHTNLHNRGAQFSFLDGHAARFANREYWDFEDSRGRTNNPDLVWIPP